VGYVLHPLHILQPLSLYQFTGGRVKVVTPLCACGNTPNGEGNSSLLSGKIFPPLHRDFTALHARPLVLLMCLVGSWCHTVSGAVSLYRKNAQVGVALTSTAATQETTSSPTIKTAGVSGEKRCRFSEYILAEYPSYFSDSLRGKLTLLGSFECELVWETFSPKVRRAEGTGKKGPGLIWSISEVDRLERKSS